MHPPWPGAHVRGDTWRGGYAHAPRGFVHGINATRRPVLRTVLHDGVMTDWQRFFQYLQRRGGVGHVRDGARFGLSSTKVGNYWRRNGWPMPFTGVVALPGTEMDLRRRVLAATTWIGDPVAATGVTALRLQGVTDKDPTRLQLVVPATRRNRRGPWGETHRSDIAFEQPIRQVAGIPTMPVPWALRDRVVFGGPGRPRTHAIRAMQRRVATLEELEEAACETPRSPGVPDLLEVLRTLRRDRVDSGLELDTRDVVRADGHRPWQRPFPTRCPDSRVIHLDIALPQHWVSVECEDPHTHGDEAFTRDRTRWSQARRGGWQLIFVWRERLLEDRTGFLEEIAEAVAAADPTREPALPAHDCEALNC